MLRIGNQCVNCGYVEISEGEGLVSCSRCGSFHLHRWSRPQGTSDEELLEVGWQLTKARHFDARARAWGND